MKLVNKNNLNPQDNKAKDSHDQRKPRLNDSMSCKD